MIPNMIEIASFKSKKKYNLLDKYMEVNENKF